SVHIFINAGLGYFVQTTPDRPQPIRILEIGTGTGLNAALASEWALDRGIPIQLVTMDPDPISREIQNNYLQHLTIRFPGPARHLESIYQTEWNTEVPIHPYFSLTQYQYPLAKLPEFESEFNVIWMDAFSPDSCPDLWHPDSLHFISMRTCIGSVLTTYCAKGEVRRRLADAGWQMERLPGPPGKREMLRGRM
ncbi:hypothetical protein EBR96_05605, partial [bacterium]|nr:hypothetical protein [bacterium]